MQQPFRFILIVSVQKQPPRGVQQKRCAQKCRKIHRKHLSQSLYNFNYRESPTQVFSCGFREIVKNTFFLKNTSSGGFFTGKKVREIRSDSHYAWALLLMKMEIDSRSYHYPDEILGYIQNNYSWSYKGRSSRSQMFFKIGVLKNIAIFTGKQLCWVSFCRALHSSDFNFVFVFTGLWNFIDLLYSR